MKVFEQRITARSEDIDELGHVNNAAWVRWASVTLGYQSRRLCQLSSSASSSTRGCPGSCQAAVNASASVIDSWASRSPPIKDRKSGEWGKSVSVRVDLGGRRNLKKKTE